MSVFYGCKHGSVSFCEVYGEALLAISEDETLNEAILKCIGKKYKTVFENNKNGVMVSRKIFLDNYIWPKNFKTQVMNHSKNFKQFYGLDIFPCKAKGFIVGLFVDPKDDFPIHQYLNMSDTKNIDDKIKRVSKLIDQSGVYYIVPNN